MFRINKSNAFKIIKIKCKVCILDSVFINNSINRIKYVNVSVCPFYNLSII